MMTTSSEHEPTPNSHDTIDAQHETVANSREERRQAGEWYIGRHRPAPPDHADGHSDPI
jgi:hypothetical protein